MAAVAQNPTPAGTVQDHDQDSYLADRAGGLSLAEQGQSEEFDRDVEGINQDRKAVNGDANPEFNGAHDEAPSYNEHRGTEEQQMLDSPYSNYPNSEQPHEERPSYVAPLLNRDLHEKREHADIGD